MIWHVVLLNACRCQQAELEKEKQGAAALRNANNTQKNTISTLRSNLVQLTDAASGNDRRIKVREAGCMGMSCGVIFTCTCPDAAACCQQDPCDCIHRATTFRGLLYQQQGDQHGGTQCVDTASTSATAGCSRWGVKSVCTHALQDLTAQLQHSEAAAAAAAAAGIAQNAVAAATAQQPTPLTLVPEAAQPDPVAPVASAAAIPTQLLPAAPSAAAAIAPPQSLGIPASIIPVPQISPAAPVPLQQPEAQDVDMEDSQQQQKQQKAEGASLDITEETAAVEPPVAVTTGGQPGLNPAAAPFSMAPEAAAAASSFPLELSAKTIDAELPADAPAGGANSGISMNKPPQSYSFLCI